MSNTNSPEAAMIRTLTLAALVALRDLKQVEQIKLLDRAGFGPTDIARLVESTPKAVSVRLAEIRRATRTNKKH